MAGSIEPKRLRSDDGDDDDDDDADGTGSICLVRIGFGVLTAGPVTVHIGTADMGSIRHSTTIRNPEATLL